MPYTKQTWANTAAGGTPLSAARLNVMENGISDTYYSVPVVVSGTTRTITAADAGSQIRFTNASLVTVTIPTDAAEDLPDGFWCALYAEGVINISGAAPLYVTFGNLAPTDPVALAQGTVAVYPGTTVSVGQPPRTTSESEDVVFKVLGNGNAYSIMIGASGLELSTSVLYPTPVLYPTAGP